MQPLKVQNSSGDIAEFSVDRFAGTMVRIGILPADAFAIANSLAAVLKQKFAAVGDPVPTSLLSHLAVNAVETDLRQSGVQQLLNTTIEPFLAANTARNLPQASLVQGTAAPVALRGPSQYGLVPLRMLFNGIRELDNDFSEYGLALIDFIGAAVEQVVEKKIPLFADAVGKTFGLEANALKRFKQRLLADIPGQPLTRATMALIEKYEKLVEKNFFGKDDPIDEATQKKLITYLTQALRTPHGSWDVPEGMDFVKVATTERLQLLYNPRSTADTSAYPLYCSVATDESVLSNTGNDEPQAVEVNYRGNIVPALIAPDDSVPSATDVTAGWMKILGKDWKGALTDDLPLKPPGYWDGVPVGIRVHYYNWFLIEPDSISSSKLFKEGLKNLEKTLDDQKKELADKAQKAVDDALKGTNYPGSNLVGQLAGEIVKFLVPWLIDMLSDNKFPTITITHITVRPDVDVTPFSQVSMTTNKAIQPLLKPETDATGRITGFTKNYSRISDQVYYSAWYGPSAPAPHSPWGLKEAVAKAPKGAAVVWRKPVNGFGVFVQQNEPNSAFWTKDGVYVTCLRADVRLVSKDDPNFGGGV